MVPVIDKKSDVKDQKLLKKDKDLKNPNFKKKIQKFKSAGTKSVYFGKYILIQGSHSRDSQCWIFKHSKKRYATSMKYM